MILVDVNTLSDCDPRNNHLQLALTWNENGALDGVRHLAIAGNTFYASTPRGVVVIDMSEALKPRYIGTVTVDDPRAVQVQFRYAFVTTAKGLQVIDVTNTDAPRLVESALIPIADAHKLHVARTFAYVAAGKEGIVIVDVTNPELPKLYQRYNGNGAINDARDIMLASTNASLFAYVADGRNGLKVLQLTSPESQPKFYGYSPDPKPELIASYATKKPALSLSRALERDRAVDETGGQIAVLGRLGSRPMNASEMRNLYLDKDGKPWFVDDKIDGPRGITSPVLPHKPNRIAPQMQPSTSATPGHHP